MKTTKMLTILVLALGLMVCSARLAGAAPLGTAFMYQGLLIDGNDVLDGSYDLMVSLFDDPNEGELRGTVFVDDLDVNDGWFEIMLDFGDGVFDGSALWLETAVRPGELDDPNEYVILLPRWEVTPTPYALYAKTAGTAHALDAADGAPTHAVYVHTDGNVGIGTTVPAYALDVKGDIRASDAIGVGEGTLWIDSATDAITSTSGKIYLGRHPPGSFEDINVGIGTLTPGAKLDVAGDIGVNGSQVINSLGQWVGDPNGLQGPQGPPGDSHWGLSGTDTYYEAGNVGIGTTHPTAKLEVATFIGRFLFSIGLECQDDLDDGRIPGQLWQEFERIGPPSREHARYSVEEADSEWLITVDWDHSGRRIYKNYTVRKEQGRLNVNMRWWGFAAGWDLRDALDQGIIAAGLLRQLFAEIWTPLSQDAKVQVQEPGSRWLITDESNNYTLYYNRAWTPWFRIQMGGGPPIEAMAIYGYSGSIEGTGVYGEATGTSGNGVRGISTSGVAVYGYHENTGNFGVLGLGGSDAGGVYGWSDSGNGVGGVSTTGSGVAGYSSSGYGVYGRNDSTMNYGALGGSTGGNTGVVGSGNAYDFYAEGPGTDYGSESSIRWKRDIRPIDDPLDKVMNLRGVYFNWDKEHGGHHDVGMIAEEVGEVLPEIVQYEEDGIYTSGMDYSKLTPLLVEAVKELKRENDRLRQRLEALEKTAQQNESVRME